MRLCVGIFIAVWNEMKGAQQRRVSTVQQLIEDVKVLFTSGLSYYTGLLQQIVEYYTTYW